ncbi:MAG: AraC family transcriptional regulator, partial [Clostridia bacterium]|nr:AraC family transcriptional regulator [Clostridia bacterium]
EYGDDAEAPEGWVKWVIPAYDYLKVEREGNNTFSEMWQYMKANGIPLAGAVHDYSCPRTGKDYMFFPIRKR